MHTYVQYMCYVHTFLLCYIDHIHECMCVRARMLIASHQTLVVSASTLYESELQYSVGGAGIGYPAGGSSTHTHARTHTFVLLYLCGTSVMEYIRNLTTFRSKDEIHREATELKLRCKRAHMKNTLRTPTDTCSHSPLMQKRYT